MDSGSKFTGGAGDDTFVATSGDPAATTTAPTLTAGDSLDGGIGNDTLQLAVAANAPTPSAQISTKSIENVAITNNRGAAYTLDATTLKNHTTLGGLYTAKYRNIKDELASQQLQIAKHLRKQNKRT